MLYDGKILTNNAGSTKDLKFSETELNLTRFSTKTTTTPKMQEISTYDVVGCIVMVKNLSNSSIWDNYKNRPQIQNCGPDKLNNSFQELIKRTILPFYLPVLTLIACLMIMKSKDDFNFLKHKIILFLLGVSTVIVSELTLKYTSNEILQNILIALIPVILFIIIYFYFIKIFTRTNLVKT